MNFTFLFEFLKHSKQGRHFVILLELQLQRGEENNYRALEYPYTKGCVRLSNTYAINFFSNSPKFHKRTLVSNAQTNPYHSSL